MHELIARLAVLVLLAALLLLGAASGAGAYAAPAGLTYSGNECATRPADPPSSDTDVQAQTVIEQQIAVDACDLAAQNQAQTHSDLNGIDSDLTAKLDKLDGDVNQLDSDLKAFAAANHTDLTSNGSGSSVTVTNWPSDQTVGFDSASTSTLSGDAQANHEDLWILIGAIIGCFAFEIFLRRVWP